MAVVAWPALQYSIASLAMSATNFCVAKEINRILHIGKNVSKFPAGIQETIVNKYEEGDADAQITSNMCT